MNEFKESHNPYLGPAVPRLTVGESLVHLAHSSAENAGRAYNIVSALVQRVVNYEQIPTSHFLRNQQ